MVLHLWPSLCTYNQTAWRDRAGACVCVRECTLEYVPLLDSNGGSGTELKWSLRNESKWVFVYSHLHVYGLALPPKWGLPLDSRLGSFGRFDFSSPFRRRKTHSTLRWVPNCWSRRSRDWGPAFGPTHTGIWPIKNPQADRSACDTTVLPIVPVVLMARDVNAVDVWYRP